MKRKFITLFTIITIAATVSYGQKNLLSIDSLYMNSIVNFYENLQKVIDEIWPGMECAPVCLYRVDGPAFLYNHPNPPGSFLKLSDKLYIGSQNDTQLSGATQIEINSILVAIIDYGLDYYLTTDEVFAELFHELHHVYQRNQVKNIEYDNPAVLMTYPEDYINDGIKLFEQMVLFKMCFAENDNEFRHYLNQFYSCRIKRRSLIGEYSSYEKSVENMEGPAFYCEYQFYKQFTKCDSLLKENYLQKHFWGVLTTPYYGRENLRLRHLTSGMAICFILNKYYQDWKSEFYKNSVNLFDFFISKFNPHLVDLPDLDRFYTMSKFHTEKEITEHISNLQNFNSQPGIKVIMRFNTTPQFRGFDPMHAESINDSTILHKTLLKLENNNNQLFITNYEALTSINEQIWFINKVEFFVTNKSDIKYNDDKIIVSNNHMNIEWAGKLIHETDNLIIYKCD